MTCTCSSTMCTLDGQANIKEVPTEVQPFWSFYEEIAIEDGLLLLGTRIIIPTSQRQDLLKQLYAGHLGLAKCLQGAKETIY